jgi:hypothetical protein
MGPRRERMKISEYFKTAKGRGVLATADKDGRVDVAVYSSPHIIDEQTVAFIMIERLTHHNLQSNPHAAYLFMEEEEKYKGIRLFLTKTREEKGGEQLEAIRRKQYPDLKDKEYLVYFRVDKVLPLIGAGPEK